MSVGVVVARCGQAEGRGKRPDLGRAADEPAVGRGINRTAGKGRSHAGLRMRIRGFGLGNARGRARLIVAASSGPSSDVTGLVDTGASTPNTMNAGYSNTRHGDGECDGLRPNAPQAAAHQKALRSSRRASRFAIPCASEETRISRNHVDNVEVRARASTGRGVGRGGGGIITRFLIIFGLDRESRRRLTN